MKPNAEKLNTVTRMSGRADAYIFTETRDDTTDIIKLPRADGNAEACVKSDKLGKLSMGVATTKLGLAIRVLKCNKEKAGMQLDPEMTQMIGAEAMMCEDLEHNKYVIKGLDSGTTAKDVAQIMQNCASRTVKPLNPTKGQDKRKPDYLVCASTPPKLMTFALKTNR